MSAEIIELDIVTTHDVPVERILRKASEKDLEGVVAIGWDKEGQFYFASSYADGPEVLWLLEMAKVELFKAASVIPEVEDE